MQRAILIVVALSLVLVLSACGGDETPVADDAVTVDTGEAAEKLEEEAATVRGIVDERVRGLTEARSLDELSEELRGAREELEGAADDVAESDVGDDLTDERDELEQAVRDLVAELEGVQAEVDENDLRGALEELRGLEAVQRVDQAVERVRAETATE